MKKILFLLCFLFCFILTPTVFAEEPPESSSEITETQEDVFSAIRFTLENNTFTYTGSEIKPEPQNVEIEKNGEWIPYTDYTVQYSNNINAGKGEVIINGMAEGEGLTAKESFTISKANQNIKITVKNKKIKYSKTGKINVSGAFGKVSYSSSNKKIVSVNQKGVFKGKRTGKASIFVNVAGNNNYNPTKTQINITVVGKKLTKSNTKIKLNKKNFTYNGKKRNPKVTVKYKKKTLKKNRDYKLTYKNNIMPGKAYVIITGIGKYMGMVKKSYKIKKIKNPIKVTLKENHVDIKKTISFKVKNAVGEVSYSSSNPKIAKVSDKGVITGISQGNCTITVKASGDKTRKAYKKKFKIRVGYYSIKDCSITLSDKTFTYNGSAIKPTVVVKYKKITLKEGTDYSLTYKNNINAGTASVIVKGQKTYTDSKTIKFTIHKINQTDFKVEPLSKTINVGDTFSVTTSGQIGRVTYKTHSPSYLKDLGNGNFKGIKKTQNYVSVTVMAEGDQNHNSKSYDIIVHIK